MVLIEILACLRRGWNLLKFMIKRFWIVSESTQLEDPRQEWRQIQEDMLRDYLQKAQDALDVSESF